MFIGENIVIRGKNKTIQEVIIMSRTARSDMKDSSFFHIIVQGLNKEFIFNSTKEKEKYLNLINENKENVEIIAYCIMGNHAHFLTFPNKISDLENWMKKVNTKYAMYYNKKNNRVGYVFKDRYKSQPIKNIKHLYLCANYIHNNPVKAEICKKPEEYEFSSFNKIYKSDQNSVYKRLSQLTEGDNFINETIKNEEIFVFIDEEKESKEDICRDIINQYLSIEGVSIEELRKQKEALTKIVGILRNRNKISYRIIGQCLGINREKLRRLMAKQEKNYEN